MAGALSIGVATLAVLAGSAAVCARLGLRGVIDLVLAFSTIALTQLALTMLVAGAAFRRLEPEYVLGLNLLLSAAALAYGGKALVSSARRAGRPARAAARHLLAWPRAHPWATALVLLATAALAWRVVIAYTLPPHGFDALWYHLTTAAWWLQDGSVGVTTLNGGAQQMAYPATGALLYAWVPLFVESDTWIEAGQLPLAAVGAVAVAGLARRFDVPREWAAAAGAMFVLTPIVVTQTTSGYVDLAVAVVELVALYFLLRAVDPTTDAPPPRHPRAETVTLLVLAGLATGLAVGIKATALGFAAVFGAVLAVELVLAARAQRLTRRRAGALLSAFLVPIVVLGGYWYARNWVEFDNPLYPANVELLGVAVFDGPGIDLSQGPEAGSDSAVRHTIRAWGHDALTPLRLGQADNVYTEEQRLGGLGPIWSYLGFPALLIAGAWAAWRSRRLLWTLLIPIAILFVAQPYPWWSRFTIFHAAIGIVAAVVVATRLPWAPARLAVRAAILVLVLVQAWNTASVERWGRELGPGDIVALAGEPAKDRTFGGVFVSDYGWVDRIPESSRVGTFLPQPTKQNVEQSPPLFYPLYGPDLANEVLWVDPAGPRELQRQIAELRLDYVYLARIARVNSWAARSPSLRAVHTGRFGSAYEVVGTAAALSPRSFAFSSSTLACASGRALARGGTFFLWRARRGSIASGGGLRITSSAPSSCSPSP